MTAAWQGMRHLRRAVTVFRVLARHDAAFVLERFGAPRFPVRAAGWLLLAPRSRGVVGMRRGERLRTALIALGPAFVKIGQALSVRPDLVGEEMADDLAALQDDMPSTGGGEVRTAIEREFEQPLDELFSEFEDEAVAAASIAQVHRAITTEGVEVAVKVLRPKIEDAFARDLGLARWAAGLIERRLPRFRRLRPADAVETIARSVEMEMDLRLEGAAADELRANFADEAYFSVPDVDWQRTGRRVLTMRWVDGIPIDRIGGEDGNGVDPGEVVASLARIFFLQVFRDGFFHADLHPGNLFVDEDGVVHAVDFGIMGRLDLASRRYLAEMLHGFLTGDYDRVARAHLRAGYVPPHHSPAEFAQAARSIAEPILGLPLGEISLARLLAQLFAVTRRFDMQTQPQLLLLQKTMLVAEGVGRGLCPGLNMWELARPLVESWMRSGDGAEARLREAADGLLDALERFPQVLKELERSAADAAARRQEDSAPVEPAADRTAPGRAWPAWIVAAILVLAAVAALG